MWSTARPVQESAPEPPNPTEDVADTGEAAGGVRGSEQLIKPPVPMPPSRPGLQRHSLPAGLAGAPGPAQGMQPQPQRQQQHQQQNNSGNPGPTDSLSLLQLRRMVAEVNRAEPVVYNFAYSDMGPHAEEIDEWFVYQFWQWVRLNAAQRAFEWHWSQESDGQHSWDDADRDMRARFIQAAIAGVQSNDAALRSASIGKLVYLVLGRWGDTAMPNAADRDGRSIASLSQLQAVKAGVECLASLEGIPVIWDALRSCFELHWSGDAQQQASPQEAQDELMNLMTIMYIAIQETLNSPSDMSLSHKALFDLDPSLVDFMLTATSKLRWDESNSMPLTQIFLLFWKSILLVFGGTKDLADLKAAMSETKGLQKDTITASPLDYHVFRQEITSKYPAYVPPQPLIPLEDENTSSLLPPIPSQFVRNNGAGGIISTPGQSQNGGASILNQPVHIATPAPSPPPSPGVGGKSGKKQNYQTNQNFPFMYPPLDATSNSAGGKGMAGIDDSIVSRRWEGSDIPASILEAGELFSTRVRMTRATRQMWEEREQFLRFERGWADDDGSDDGIDNLDLSELTLEEREVLKELRAEDKPKKATAHSHAEFQVDFGPHPERLSDRDKQRLQAVERFYKQALPHLQSLVIVLLRPILVNVTAIVAQQAGQMPNGAATRGNNPGMSGGGGGHAGPRPSDANAQMAAQDEADPSPEEVDAARTREITSKATTAILLLLLKWLRLSHLLKFEYLTQLLLDSNYVPLVLKLFAHQDVQQVVDSKMDRVENSFFQFCNLRSKFKDRTGNDAPPEEEEDDEADKAAADQKPQDLSGQEAIVDSEDDAAPPPIRKHRSPAAAHGKPEAPDGPEAGADDDDQAASRPEVDELGYPVNPLPEEPITDFSWRNFFSLINYLRVLHKTCKNKAHRNLLLVQYKSSTILRKSLRVPQPELRLYTLKLFKNQVPYCGRKWRQSNMRVITAVYLHCRPELRDEWLAGSDVDAEVDAALPLEQALRSLTHWFNVRRYPEQIAPDIRVALREEHDFFSRELEKLDGGGWADDRGDEMSDWDHGEGWA